MIPAADSDRLFTRVSGGGAGEGERYRETGYRVGSVISELKSN